MPFDTSPAESVPTRSSSRHRNADSATSVTIEEASPAAPSDVPVSPLSRRALRERMRAAATEIVVETLIEEPAQTAIASDSVVDDPALAEDAFVAASRAFAAVTSSLPVAQAPSVQRLPNAATEIHTASRRAGRRRKVFAAGATVGIMGIAGMLAVSMTLPAEALAAAQGGQTSAAMSLVAASQSVSSSETDEIQAYVASSDVQNEAMQRSEGFSAASLIDLAAEQGISYSNRIYTNDPTAAIQWPFIVGVGMSYGYGMRNGTLHEGLDLLPGDGAPVQSIADGKVRIATESGGNYGVTVYIDHMIDGKLITSHYAHMQYGSLQVVAGQTVEVGDIIGKVGNTGRSYGAHMHFELIVDGSTIDPLPWFTENAGRDDGVSPVS